MIFKISSSISVKVDTWANNYQISSHLRAKLLNPNRKLKFIPKIKLFAWKPSRGKIPISENLRKMGIGSKGGCKSCDSYLENIDNLVRQCRFGI